MSGDRVESLQIQCHPFRGDVASRLGNVSLQALLRDDELPVDRVVIITHAMMKQAQILGAGSMRELGNLRDAGMAPVHLVRILVVAVGGIVNQ